MLDWVSQNSSALVAFSNLLMVLVWAFYLQLFIYGYRRQRRSRILIGFGGRESFEARCLISNMSAEPIYVISVIATVRTGRGAWSHAVTTYEGSERDSGDGDTPQRTREGPLLSGHYRDIGSFGDLLERALHVHGVHAEMHEHAAEDRPDEMELTVVAAYGPEDLPVAAKRRFELALEDGRQEIRPASADTAQVRGKGQRRRLRRTVNDAPWERVSLPQRKRPLVPPLRR